MALFTDGSIASLSDLKAYETSILELAGTENIDLTAKLSLAQRELGLELTRFLLRRGAMPDARRDLSNVVVNEPLLHSHVISTLALTFRDACNSQMNDRYQAKWKQYSELAERAIRQLMDIGVGLTRMPLPKAPMPVLGTRPGGLLPGTDYQVSIAISSTSGVTGEWSDPVRVSAVPGLLVTAQVPTLTSGPVSDAAGFVVYAGESDDAMTRQTETAVPFGSQWIQSIAGLRKDLSDFKVQSPDYFVANRQELMRG